MDELAPWSIPVPLKPSRFRALDPAHQQLNVETDLASILAFDGRGGRDPAWLGHADLQLGANEQRRLGSGRSCSFRGKYLKGIGRTQLAGNWSDPDDVYHASGHMLPSGALREYVVSRFLEARGLGHTIVGCEGLLLAEQDPRLADFHARSFAELVARGGEPRAIDRHLQAITVKPASFTRFSNYAWLLQHWYAPRAFTSFFARLAEDLGVGAATSGPDDLVKGLDAAIGRGLDHFRAYFRAGVFWGSFYNNSTLDGRMLDLEVPSILGRPYCGLYVDQLPDGERSTPFYIVPGCEAFVYLNEARRFVLQLRHALDFVPLQRWARDPRILEFVADLVAALDDTFSIAHLVHDDDAAHRAVTELLVEALAPGPAAAAGLAQLARTSQQWILGERTVPLELTDAWIELPFAAAPRETMVRQVFYWPRSLPMPSFDEGREVNQLLEELDATTSVDAVFTRLRQAYPDRGAPSPPTGASARAPAPPSPARRAYAAPAAAERTPAG
jgi:hypothetical protein